jgi:uncharacterized protein YdhG (YjbR/CyaY superfamily)
VGHPGDDYLARVPSEQRIALEQLRATIRSVTPESEETIKQGVPVYRFRGRPLVSIGSARHHVALYIRYGDVLDRHLGELNGYDVSKTVIRFSPDQPIPVQLVAKLVKARLAELEDAPPPAPPRHRGPASGAGGR